MVIESGGLKCGVFHEQTHLIVSVCKLDGAKRCVMAIKALGANAFYLIRRAQLTIDR